VDIGDSQNPLIRCSIMHDNRLHVSSLWYKHKKRMKQNEQ